MGWPAKAAAFFARHPDADGLRKIGEQSEKREPNKEEPSDVPGVPGLNPIRPSVSPFT
jgi:hypothetical protein